jgi:preprotein translocase YajC subunit
MYHKIQMMAVEFQHLLLAQDAGGEEAPAADGGQGSGFLLVLLAFMVFMLLFSGRGKKKHKQKRNDMLMSISKYTEITTIGGICGTVVEIETTTVEDDAEPVPTHFLLEVDASSGSRLRIVAEAVGRVVDNTEEEA